jgi:predicted phosphodiesterase
MKILLLTDTHSGYNKNTYNTLNRFFDKVVSKYEFDIVVHCGDWISNSQNQWKSIFKLIRKHIPNKVILGVKGNHDYWHNESYVKLNGKLNRLNNIEDRIKYQKEVWKEYNIQYLEDKPYILKDIEIYGFDGWYNNSNPPTNDYKYIPQFVDGKMSSFWFNHKNYKKLEHILNKDNPDNKIKILVTHFGCFSNELYSEGLSEDMNGPNYFKFLKDHFNYILYGHTHKRHKIIHDNVEIFNTGSHYNKPKCMIIDIENININKGLNDV